MAENDDEIFMTRSLSVTAKTTEHQLIVRSDVLLFLLSLASFCFCRAMHKRGLCRHALSVSMCVCMSCSLIMSKRIKVSSNFFTIG